MSLSGPDTQQPVIQCKKREGEKIACQIDEFLKRKYTERMKMIVKENKTKQKIKTYTHANK